MPSYIARGIDMDEDAVDERFDNEQDARAYVEAVLYDVHQVIRVHDGVETIVHQLVYGRPSWNINQ